MESQRFFFKKLSTLLSRENKSIVKWTNDGKSFVILDTIKFERYVLRKYYKSLNSFTDFEKKLIESGFEKKNFQGMQTYHHQFWNKFNSKQDDLLSRHQISRKRVIIKKNNPNDLLDSLSCLTCKKDENDSNPLFQSNGQDKFATGDIYEQMYASFN